MKAILTYLTMTGGKSVEHTQFFDTAKKIYDVKNSFGKKVQEILRYQSKKR